MARSQTVTPRAPKSVAVQDAYEYATFGLKMPKFADTTAANLMIGHDSLGCITCSWAHIRARRLNLAGFSLAFAISGKLWPGRFKSRRLGAVDAAGGTNRPAHRCSKRRCR